MVLNYIKKYTTILLCLLSLNVFAIKKYDIVIYGGTSAGVIAAYTAKKMGKSVVLIVPDGHIGGLSSGGLGQTDIGHKSVIGGYSRDFYKKAGAIYNKPEAWAFEPKVASEIFSSLLNEASITIILNKKVLKVYKTKNKIVSLLLSATFNDKQDLENIEGSIFIDCTYEGDLLDLAKISYTIGREDNKIYNETLNGYQLAEYLKKSGRHQFPDNIDPYKIPQNPSSGLVYGISKEKPGVTGTGDKKVQAYNFRVCLTDSAENRISITKPIDYDSSKYELLGRLIQAQPKFQKVNDYFIWSKMPNRKTDINNRGGFSTDMIGTNYNWPKGNFEERKKIFEAHLSYTKGLLYFMITDKRIPKKIQNYIKNWGYPKDEYINNNHFTPQLYIREGRRMIGEYVMTEKNCIGKEVVSDPIGMAAYTMDSHNTQRIIINGMVKNEGNVEVGKFDPYPISYRAIIPKEKECSNLIVPVALSASHIAFGSIRMEPVFMILGQSAAIAASIAISDQTSVQKLNYTKLKEELLKQNQILQFYK